MNYISPKDWMDKHIKDTQYQLIDIRETYECADCKVNALHIPMAELAGNPEKLDQQKKNVIMCQSGRRAEALVNLLETDFQIHQLHILEGGYSSLIELI